MQHLLSSFLNWLQPSARRGQGNVEYGLVLALVGVVAIGALTLMGDTIVERYEEINCALENRGDPACFGNPPNTQAAQAGGGGATNTPAPSPTASAEAVGGGGTNPQATLDAGGGGGGGGGPTSTNTPAPTATFTATLQPTATFTNTPVPNTPTATPVPPTATPVPPTATNTPVPPTATPTPLPVYVTVDEVVCRSNKSLRVYVSVHNAPDAVVNAYIVNQNQALTRQSDNIRHQRNWAQSTAQAKAYCTTTGSHYSQNYINLTVTYNGGQTLNTQVFITRP